MNAKEEYKKLMVKVKNDDYFKIDVTNRVNCYVCQCGHVTKTRDVDPGCTPFMHTCEKCGSMAISTFYNDIAPKQKPTQEWYRPSLEQFLKLSPSMQSHVLSGGLDLRILKP
jgi:hypothetical protein